MYSPTRFRGCLFSVPLLMKPITSLTLVSVIDGTWYLILNSVLQ